MPRQRPTRRLCRRLCAQTLMHCHGSQFFGLQTSVLEVNTIIGNEDGDQDGVPRGHVYRGHAFVDARMHLLAPALILPPIPTSPHVATLE